jgi:hypothetical protein
MKPIPSKKVRTDHQPMMELGYDVAKLLFAIMLSGMTMYFILTRKIIII